MKGLLISLLSALVYPVLAQISPKGLQGEYYQGASFKQKIFTRIDPQINFHWTQHSKLKGSIEATYFSVRWTGQIYAPSTASYYFSAETDDNVQIWVNNQLVLDKLAKVNQYKFGGSVITLIGKQWYSIKIEYCNEGFIGDGKPRNLVLYWDTLSDCQEQIGASGAFRKVIPAHYFSPVSPPTVQRVAVSNNPSSKQKVKSNGKPNNKPVKNFNAITKRLEPSLKEPAIKLEKEKSIVLRQVQFEQSTYFLREESFPILNQLAQELVNNPSVRVEISGHTDNVGDARLNLTLSEYRARQVANYLIKHGVKAGQLVVRGYGSQRPVADNKIESERIKNRRVEVTVL